MADLVTLETAMQRLGLGSPGSPLSSHDEMLQLMLDQAEAICLRYIKEPDDADWSDEIDSWTIESVPEDIMGAILYMFGFLHRHRGDDVAQDIPRGEDFYPPWPVRMMLDNYRHRALA